MAHSVRPARGMRDFLPQDVRRREHVIRVVEDVYRRYGFQPLETPALENIETLTGKYGEEGNRLIFKVLRRGEHEASGETDLALRYDLTVPLARVVAEHAAQLPKFFKRYQIQPVWRADRPARGRYREFYQCDVDAIGSRSPVIEAEILGAASEVLERLGFSDFVIRINHRVVLSTLLTHAGVAADQQGAVLVTLDKLDKIGRDGVARELSARGIDEPARDRLLTWLGTDPGTDRLDWLQRQFTAVDDAGRAAFENVRAILHLSGSTGAARHLRFDPSLARGLSYYTGAIMEVAVPEMAGSLGGGGRYDGLIGMFSGRDIPACGFSLGLERILVVMGERGMFPAGVDAGAADVLVAQFSAETAPEALQIAAALRAGGWRVEVYPEPDKLGRQFKYASDAGVAWVAVLGPEEHAAGVVKMKDMRSGDQAVVPRAAVAAWLARAGAGPAAAPERPAPAAGDLQTVKPETR